MRVLAIGKPPGSKLLRIEAQVERHGASWLVASFRVRGDFFAIPEEGYEAAEAALGKIELDRLGEAFDTAMARAGVSLTGISGAGVQATIEEALHGR
ncbi:MAG TPA: hypothetical protein VIO60_01815 [Rectinemataceae bacterium]